MEYVILKVAERWHMHPGDVDPRGQRPSRARWFWWAVDTLLLEAKFRER